MTLSISHLTPPSTLIAKSHCAKMGLNHPGLALLLCPVRHLKDYQNLPSRTKAKLKSGDINMDACAWPSLLYKGEVAGEHFDLNNRQDGLFEGYLVMKHILTGPSSALTGDNFHISNTCNASIHGMMSVEAEHIAYAAVQVS
ncbi:uncharacterized protein EDB91DRAFT_1059505 [Suillus paluster]|uniref:uncharacterized protein n=1 Tax=Suillus paluster TaxID=48578 RepID=UPI001B86AE43|nr:uncharacterized protein EDB91DRAFT_1059505 [Suillus paluster]KAG1730370.1 hypothetical protein EDB91DRAFT_1059505 [Suillus paluster]